jgi:hypothetical protein
MTSAERERVQGFGRLEDGLRQAGDWYLWGPYVSERQWGTVREDYSADGDARSRAYWWGEGGMAGFSDVEQRLCLGLVLWNGRDPILKERMFGLTGAQATMGGGRQGVLVVPGRRPQSRLEPLALPLPPGREVLCGHELQDLLPVGTGTGVLHDHLHQPAGRPLPPSPLDQFAGGSIMLATGCGVARGGAVGHERRRRSPSRRRMVSGSREARCRLPGWPRLTLLHGAVPVNEVLSLA